MNNPIPVFHGSPTRRHLQPARKRLAVARLEQLVKILIETGRLGEAVAALHIRDLLIRSRR